MTQRSPETSTKLLAKTTREENKPAIAKPEITSIAMRSGRIDRL
jgi:hypothetical protein